MTDLVDYLRDKLDVAKAGCTCPTAEFLSTLPPGSEAIVDCVEHGRQRRTAGGFGYQMVGRTLWWCR